MSEPPSTGRVSLILPPTPGSLPLDEAAGPLAEALRARGHEVEIIGMADPGTPGPAAAAAHGINHATGLILVVVDPSMGYTAEDVCRVVGALDRGEADLAVGCRAALGEGLGEPRPLRAGLGRLARPMVGTGDPTSGLIGLTAALRDDNPGAFNALGSKFSFELLARLGGRWLDVPARPVGPRRRRPPEFDDVRHLKRLADHRFGNLSRLVQFCVVGGSGMVVDLGMYVLWKAVFARSSLAGRSVPYLGPADLAAAAALSIGMALSWNFWLNRRLTFSDARHGSVVRQYLVYALSNLLGIVFSFSLRLLLPRYVPFFAGHKLLAAVVGIVLATGMNFSMARWVVFARRGTGKATSADALAETLPAP